MDLDAWVQIIIWIDEEDYRKLQYTQKSTRESKYPPLVILGGWNSLAKRGTSLTTAAQKLKKILYQDSATEHTHIVNNYPLYQAGPILIFLSESFLHLP